MKISFDFDDCLTKRSVQKLAKGLVMSGHDIWIVTSRSGTLNTNKDVESIATKIGLPTNNIVFVGDWKWTYFINQSDFDFHIDDYYYEINEINNKTKVQAFPCDLKLFFGDIRNDIKS